MTKAATIPRIGLKEMGTNRPSNWRRTVERYLKQSRWRCLDHPWPISRWLSELTVLFLHVAPLPQPIKSLAHWLSVRGVGLWTGSTPPPRLPASKIKQTFLSTNLASLLAFEWRAAWPHFRLHRDQFGLMRNPSRLSNHLTTIHMN